MSAIRSSSSALLLLGGVATLPGAATVRSQFPQRSSTTLSTTTAEQAELGYMQQPLGPASSRTTTHTAGNAKRSGGGASGLTAAQVVTMSMTTIQAAPLSPRVRDRGAAAGFRYKSAEEVVAVVLGRNQQYQKYSFSRPVRRD
ncbi:hypothetical protein CLIM01_06579 [Colletotrichum limetticola]|uniref:Uncharacterized protein n=1 Tax=Colletotrichum limetticola TaxID=1209924 RepID=A0ABQ9PWY6_9PEZI|nr:hypothetical protein CLIM01_06579 [Colletotrichum limetticola]